MNWKYETYGARRRRIAQWHKWFAWHPVWTDMGTGHWLETVEAKYEDFYDIGYWKYRPITTPSEEPKKLQVGRLKRH